MAHRFVDTNKWSEDWYCELKGEYQKLWDYICDHCDNGGIWKPNKIDFEIKTGFKVNLDSFLKKVNGDKERIIQLGNGRWFIPGFIQYQWFNRAQSFDLVLSNPLHKHIFGILNFNEIPRGLVRGLGEVLQASKDKVKDKGTCDVDLKEGAGENFATWGSEKQKFLADGTWIFKFCRDKNLTVDEFDKRAREFLSDLELKEDYKPVKEIRSHFTNLFNKQQRNGGIKKPAAGGGKSEGANQLVDSLRADLIAATGGKANP